METTIKQAMHWAQTQLQQASDSIHADVEILLAHVLQKDRAWLHTWPDKILNHEQLQTFTRLIERRLQGEPVAYLTGKRGFWTLDLQVNRATLIPRPETELLVEQALLHQPQNQPCQVLDLGTGSGAIALAIASERPSSQVTAIEISADALAVAQANAKRLGIKNIQFLHGNWFEPLQKQCFDLIVSNPPYIACHDPHLQQGDVRHEPATALVSGEDGLDAIRIIIGQAAEYLKKDAWLLFEHGYDQADAIAKLLKKKHYKNITQVRDLAGHVRVSGGQTG